MFAGHLGAGLAAKRMAPRVNVGVLFFAAMLLDVLLWIFVLLGLEAVHVPAESGEARYLTFTFPYSHGVIASLAWAAAALLAARAWGWRAGASLVISATVLSHAFLDALVHVVGLPLFGPASYHLGLGLWRHTGLALVVECAIAGLGWWIYAGSAGAARGAARWGLAAIVALCALLTVMGALAPGPPPSARVMAATSLGTIGLVSLIAGWLDRRGSPG